MDYFKKLINEYQTYRKVQKILNHCKHFDYFKMMDWVSEYFFEDEPELRQRVADGFIKQQIFNTSKYNSVTGTTPLMLACQFESRNVELLLKAGADVNAADKDGFAPLLVAAKHNPHLIPLLLQYGANIHVKNYLETEHQYTPLLYVTRQSDRAEKQKIVHYLLDAGADINEPNDYGWTPLMIAAKYNFDLIQPLLDRGADIHIQNIDGMTALDIARGQLYSNRPNQNTYAFDILQAQEHKSQIQKIAESKPLLQKTKNNRL